MGGGVVGFVCGKLIEPKGINVEVEFDNGFIFGIVIVANVFGKKAVRGVVSLRGDN